MTHSTKTIAVLFADREGIYSQLGNTDLWDIERDARSYKGPHSVVCHPPCHLWTNLAYVNFKRYGGERNRPGNDGGCFMTALSAIRRFGGVLEHPAFTHAWKAFMLPSPVEERWIKHKGLWVCEVWQSAYGHKARKRTWLAYSEKEKPADMKWERHPGTHQCGWFDRTKPTLGKREASATPRNFAKALIGLAKGAKR